jgi:EAL domain-containing protein (putative c-di-GMP-specific phosphodiesterase class I)
LLGIPLALDDFGTGYSSLSYLRRLPVQTLKIDRSFIADIPHDDTAATLAESIISMAHGLRLNVIAEGIETESQLRRVQSYGCDAIQGYLISRPVTADAFSAMLRQDEYPLGVSAGEEALTR